MVALGAAAILGLVLGAVSPFGGASGEGIDVSEMAFGSDVEWDPNGEWDQP
jgi:hypothetical protein